MSWSRTSRAARRGVSYLLAVWFAHLYVTMGWAKFRSDSFWTGLFAHWGYPAWFRIVTGAVEVGAGVALLVPWVTTYAAAVLVVVMAGAALSLARDARMLDVLTVTLYAVGLCWIGVEWRRWRLGVKYPGETGTFH